MAGRYDQEYWEEYEEEQDILDQDPMRDQKDMYANIEAETSPVDPYQMEQDIDKILEQGFPLPPVAPTEEVHADPIRPEISQTPDIFSKFINELTTGFIPFEIREGFKGGEEQKLTSDVVQMVREEYNPNFGYTLGIDTTKFSTQKTDTLDKTAVIIKLDFDDVKHLLAEDVYQAEDFKDIRMYKEFGATETVDGIDIGMANLCTLEMTKEDDQVLREQFAIDDTGTIRGLIGTNLDHDSRVPPEYIELKLDTGIQMAPQMYDPEAKVTIAKLDRTNVENRGHLRMFEGKDEAFRQDFIEKVDAVFPDFCGKFCDEISNEVKLREPQLNSQIEYVSSLRKDTEKALNIIELDKEMGMTDSYLEFQEAKETFHETFAGKELSDISDADLVKGLETYQGYAAQIDRTDFYSKDALANILAGSNNQLSVYEQTLIRERDRYSDFSREFRGNQVSDSFISGKRFINGSEVTLSNVERWNVLCAVENVGGAGIPGLFLAEKMPTTEYKELLDQCFERVVDRFEAYNDTVSTPEEKIHATDNYELYTGSGLAITAEVVNNAEKAEMNPDDPYPKGGKYELFDKNQAVAEPDLANISSFRIDADFVRSFYDSKPEGLEKTRGEIRSDAIKEAVFRGVDSKDIVGIYIDRIGTDLTHGNLNGKMEWNYYYDKDSVKTVFSREATTDMDIQNYLELGMHEVDLLGKEDPMEPAAIRNGIEQRLEDQAEQVEKQESSAPDHATDNVVDIKGAEEDHKFEKAYNDKSFGAASKIDEEKGVEISAQKLREIKAEVEEQEKDPDKAEKLYKEKVDELKEKLETIRSDICYYSEKMQLDNDIPAKELPLHTGYQQAKLEYDSAVYTYAKMGGAVGADKFVTKCASNGELRVDLSQFLRSSLGQTIVIERVFGKDFSMKDLYQTETGQDRISYAPFIKEADYFGKLEKIVNVVFAPVLKIGEVVYRAMNDSIERAAERFEKDFAEQKEAKDVDQNDDPVHMPETDRTDNSEPIKDDMTKDEGVDALFPEQEAEGPKVDMEISAVDDVEASGQNMDQEQDNPDGEAQTDAVGDRRQENAERLDFEEKPESDAEDPAEKTEHQDTGREETEGPVDFEAADEREEEKQENLVEVLQEVPEDRSEPVAAEALDKRDKDDETEAKVDLAAAAGKEQDVESLEKEDQLPWEIDSEEDKEDMDQTAFKQDREAEEDQDDDWTELSEEEPDPIGDDSETDTDLDQMPDDLDLGIDPDVSDDIMNLFVDDADAEESDIRDPDIMEESGFTDMDQSDPEADAERAGSEESMDMAEESMDSAEDAGADPDVVLPEEPTDISSEDMESSVKQEILSAINGYEELEVILDHIGDMMLDDDLSPEDLMAFTADVLADTWLNDGAAEGMVSDILFEVMHFVDGDPFEHMESMTEHMEGQGIEADDIEKMLGEIDKLYDLDLITADEYGEADGILRDYDGITNDENGDPVSFNESNIDIVNQDIEAQMIQDAAMEDLASDLASDLEASLMDHGLDTDAAHEAAIGMEDQILSDIQNGTEIDDSYIQNNLETILSQREAMDQQDDFDFIDMDQQQDQWQQDWAEDFAQPDMEQNYQDFDSMDSSDISGE